MPYGGDPGASFADAVRFLIGDTGTTELVSDAEIAYLRSTVGDSEYAVAAECALALANKYAALVDQTIGKISTSYSQKSKQYRDLYAGLRRRIGQGGRIYAGGISIVDKETDENDTDCPTPDFTLGMMDNG